MGSAHSRNLSCPIGDLIDDELLRVFKCLPPYERLIVSEVCKRWHDLSRKKWRGISQLDLSHLPGPNFAAIIKLSLCPELEGVSAAQRTFLDFRDLRFLSRTALSSVTLHECSAMGTSRQHAVPGFDDPWSAAFSSNFQNASWNELNLSDFRISVFRKSMNEHDLMRLPATLPVPAALERLQLSDVTCIVHFHLRGTAATESTYQFRELEQSQRLECLMLNRTIADSQKLLPLSEPRFYDSLGGLGNLRELYLGSRDGFSPRLQPIFQLPRLEVLFLHNVNFATKADGRYFKRLTSEHATLRIFVLTGNLSKRRELPARLGADSVPWLHLFMEAGVAEKIRYPPEFLGAANVYSINEPLAAFLERGDIKPLFDGVWIAAKIKEAAAQGRTCFT